MKSAALFFPKNYLLAPKRNSLTGKPVEKVFPSRSPASNFPEFENVKKEIESYENKRPDWFESASLHYEVDFQVGLFQFEKGEYIPHHDHPDMTGVINVVSGNLLAKNYTIQKQDYLAISIFPN